MFKSKVYVNGGLSRIAQVALDESIGKRINDENEEKREMDLKEKTAVAKIESRC